MRALIILSLAAPPLRAQCPDGSPPPCAQRVTVLDPHRIAILPFRVTAADTLLGQGMAELLAPEFTGENGPLAVNMPTVLRVWRRAGGGIALPLDPAQVQRVAREIGAGRVVDGSIVGLGPRINVTATVTQLPGGTTLRVGPLSAPQDSLQELVGRLASALLGETGVAPANVQMRLTDSPAAMRAYLEGVARFRLGDFDAAAAGFERAFALDTLFARAALMREVTGTWGGGVAGWDSVTWKIRDRLSAQDRIYLTALLGDHFPAWRSPEQNVADRRRAAALLPQSPEAQFELADYLFHFGSVTGIADDFASARAQLDLAYRMDPQFEEVLHLLEIGLYTSDTALVRSMWTAWQPMSTDPLMTVAVARVAARVLHDSSLAGSYAHREANGWYMAIFSAEALLPAADLAQVFGVSPDGTPAGVAAGSRAALRAVWPSLAVSTGRLAWLGDSSVADWPAWQIAGAALSLIGDSVVAAALARPVPMPQWISRSGAAGPVSLALIEALRSRPAEVPELTLRLDSLVRWSIANSVFDPLHITTVLGSDLLLSVAWERLGDRRRALAALQLCVCTGIDPTPSPLAPRLRRVGRLAAQLGDTASAVRAYRRYLMLRRDADPVLIPERDSVQAALARLERR